MPSFRNLITKLNTFKGDNQLFFTISLMLLFWSIFDGIFSYISPIFILQLGFTRTQMGMIISTSSIFGAIFDFLLCKFLRNANYRRLFLLFYVLCFSYPLLFWSSSKITFFVLISMAVWGLYCDLINFASFDFIGNKEKSKNSQRFGLIGIFRSVGYTIAPILAGLLVANTVTTAPFFISFIFIFISFLFFLIFIKLSRRDEKITCPNQHPLDFFKQVVIWKKIGIILLPVLFLNTLLYVFDATFWAIGPLFKNDSSSFFTDFSGVFMSVYILPTLLIGWFVGGVTRKFGKKKTALVSFLLGNIFLLPLFYVKQPYIIILIVFISSTIASFAWPALKSAYGDYINESDDFDKEIESLNDFSTNLGYIIGPIFGGLLADHFSVNISFTILATVNIVLVSLLLLITPKKININIPE